MLIAIRNICVSIMALNALLIAPAIFADEFRSTAEEAKALVAKAIGYYDEHGREAAFAAFDDKAGEFVDHDLYIFVYGPNRTIVAHGADVALNGTPVDTFIDIHGKPFGTAIMNGATEEGVWVEYTWFNPVGRELLPKSSWIVRHDSYVFGAGIYLPEGVSDGETAAQAESQKSEELTAASSAATNELDVDRLELESTDGMMDEPAQAVLEGSVDDMAEEAVEAAKE